MNARIRTVLSLTDVIGIPVFIGWFIWRGQFSAPLSWLGFPCWLASMIAGVIFSALHWPNPVLVPLTLTGGMAMAWMFARERNILPLAAGQALLGSLAWWTFPIAWHHMLRVGPGYYYPY